MDSSSSFTMEDVLKFAIEHGIIDLPYVIDKIDMSRREEILRKHPYKIWQGKDRKWKTWVEDEAKPEGRRQVRRNTREELEDAIIEIAREKEENPTLKEVFNECNDRRLKIGKISEATHTRNRQYFNRHYSAFGAAKIKDVTPEEFSDFLEEQINEFGLSSKAFSGLKGVTRMFLKRAKKRKFIDWNVEEFFRELDVSEADFYKKKKNDSDDVFTEEELDIIIPYLIRKNDIRSLGILLMFITGMRVGELSTIKWSDYHDDYYIDIHRTETSFRDSDGSWHRAVKETPKTEAGERTVVIPKDYKSVMIALRIINPDGEYVFEKNGVRLTTESFRKSLYTICRKFGFKQKSPHKARKTYASILLDRQVSAIVVTGQLGHTDLSTTTGYYYKDRIRKEKKLEIISSIPELMIAE